MGVSFDKVDGAAWLKFDVQPAASPCSDQERTAKLVDPGFGRVFTDHMAVVRYNQAEGWHGAKVECRAIQMSQNDILQKGPNHDGDSK